MLKKAIHLHESSQEGLEFGFITEIVNIRDSFYLICLINIFQEMN